MMNRFNLLTYIHLKYITGLAKPLIKVVCHWYNITYIIVSEVMYICTVTSG